MAISIDRIVTVTSTVIAGTIVQPALIINALTENELVPATEDNQVLSFNNLTAVGDYFGTTSNEYEIAKNYFRGFTGSLTKPRRMLFSRYVQDDTAAYLFSKKITNPTATVNAIKALVTPALTTHINGVDQVLTLVQADFSAATGLTDIATILETALDAELSGATCSIIGTNQFMIKAPAAGAATSTIDFCLGNVGDLLGINEPQSPTLSQGTAGGNAAYNMTSILNQTPNWVGLTYVTRLTGDDIGDGYAVTLDLTSWIADTGLNYIGFWWEGGDEPESLSSTTNLAKVLVDNGYGTITDQQIKFNTQFQLDYNGQSTTNPITSDEIGRFSAFYTGMGASIDYTRVNSKINFAGKHQDGLEINVSNNTAYDNLLLNGYNVYGQFASRTTTYDLTENGTVGGPYAWVDNAYDGIEFSAQMQDAVATLIASVNRIPYNSEGIAQINAVLTNVVQSMKNAGVIESGNTFNAIQTQQIIELVGIDVTSLLTQNGYYIYFQPITADMRINRDPIIVYMLYTNGGAVNRVNIGQVFVS